MNRRVVSAFEDAHFRMLAVGTHVPSIDTLPAQAQERLPAR
jgi:hypothetical protein